MNAVRVVQIIVFLLVVWCIFVAVCNIYVKYRKHYAWHDDWRMCVSLKFDPIRKDRKPHKRHTHTAEGKS